MARREGSPKRFRCFACGGDFPRRNIARSGTRKDKTYWHLCRTCHAEYRAAKRAEANAYQASQSDRVLTESGYIETGWNGVPSDKSLGRRRQ